MSLLHTDRNHNTNQQATDITDSKDVNELVSSSAFHQDSLFLIISVFLTVSCLTIFKETYEDFRKTEVFSFSHDISHEPPHAR